MMRRMYFKRPSVQELIQKIFLLYHEIGYVGVYQGQEHLDDLQVAPLPGYAGRKVFKADLAPMGPVGLLLQFTHYCAAAID
eukprot:3993167-Karenia_brevis.AAC.1